MASVETIINSENSLNLEVEFVVIDGVFAANGNTLELITSSPITNFKNFTSLSDTIYNTPYSFRKEFAYSLDGITYSDYILYSSDLSLVAIDVDAPVDIYFKLKYTLLSGQESKPVLEKVVLTGERELTTTEKLFTLDSDEPVVLQPSDVYKVFSVSDYTLVLSTDDETKVKVHYRFSSDNKRTWTPWNLLTKENLSSTRFSVLRFTYFEFSFQRTVAEPITVYDLELIGKFNNITENYNNWGKLGIRPQCALKKEEPFVPCEEVDEIPTYNPYDFAKGVALYDYLGSKASMIWGHEVDYYKSDPDKNGVDVILHEYNLLNVNEEPQKVKVSVPENQFPDNETKFGQFDLSLLNTFEAHITKSEFKKVFGIETRPAQGDILYFCKLNKLFEIEHIIPDRTSFFASTFYKIVLKKYSNMAARNFSDDAQKVIDKLVSDNSLDAMFGIDVDKTITDTTNPQQFKPLSLPEIKRTISPMTTIVSEELANASLIVAQQIYQVPIKNKNTTTVSYGQLDGTMSKSDNRAISFWFRTEDYQQADTYTLINNYKNSLGYSLTLNNGQARFTYNAVNYDLSVALESDTWYCFLINFNQREERLETCIYKRNVDIEDDATLLTSPHLRLIHRGQFTLVPAAYSHDGDVYVGTCNGTNKKANWNITNIRIFNDTIDENSRDIVLNQYQVNKASSLILSDNCDSVYLLSNVGNL